MGYNFQATGYHLKFLLSDMKPQSKNNVNFTFILQVFVHQTSDFPLVSKFVWGCLDIVRSNIPSTACNGQIFKTHTYHINCSNISIPICLHLTEKKRTLTLFQKT